MMYLLQNIPVISRLCQVRISTFPLSQQFNYCIAFPIYGHFFIHVFSPLFYTSLITDFYILVQYYNRNIIFTKVKRVTNHIFLVMVIAKKFRKPFPACGTFQTYYNFSTHRISASTFSSFVAQPVQNRTQLCAASIRWS